MLHRRMCVLMLPNMIHGMLLPHCFNRSICMVHLQLYDSPIMMGHTLLQWIASDYYQMMVGFYLWCLSNLYLPVVTMSFWLVTALQIFFMRCKGNSDGLHCHWPLAVTPSYGLPSIHPSIPHILPPPFNIIVPLNPTCYSPDASSHLIYIILAASPTQLMSRSPWNFIITVCVLLFCGEPPSHLSSWIFLSTVVHLGRSWHFSRLFCTIIMHPKWAFFQGLVLSCGYYLTNDRVETIWASGSWYRFLDVQFQ